MLTIFAIPKSFRPAHTNTIQRNAIQSWTRLQPRPEVILLGRDEGTAEVAQEFGITHLPDVAYSEYGTPLLNSAFDLVQQVGQGPFFCYINSDIILLNDFMQAVQQLSFPRFMMSGQRWNTDIQEPLSFDSDWERQVRDRIAQTGWLEGPQAMDYFIFPRQTYVDLPEFAVGRPGWDNWMLYRAMHLNLELIDATPAITAVHQNHDYNHHPEGKTGAYQGAEAKRNIELIGGRPYVYFMLDLAGWQMTPTGLQRPDWTEERVQRILDMLPLINISFLEGFPTWVKAELEQKQQAIASADQQQQASQQLQAQYSEVKNQLAYFQETVEAMKTSKFWKMRQSWQKLKQSLGLKG